MKKNKESFASRAKKLIAKYSRADFDVTEKKELEEALSALAQEQEAYKQANGIGEYSIENLQPQQSWQDEPPAKQFYGGGDIGGIMTPKISYNSLSPQNMYGMQLASVDNNFVPYDFNSFAATGVPKVFNSLPSTNATEVPSDATPKAPESIIGRTQGILPSIASGLVGSVGNLISGATVKPIKLNRSYGADQISMANERNALNREASIARNIAARNSTLGSRGQYIATSGAANAAIGQGVSNAISSSYANESLKNLELKQKALDANRYIDMINYQAKLQADQDKRQYATAAINSLQSAGTDINRTLMQNAMIESLGTKDYMVVPSTNKAWKDILFGRDIKGVKR